jgi:DNA-binding PadR family transcriptional regulator
MVEYANSEGQVESRFLMSQQELTELEGCVLGVVATRGPITPYAVRREFRESPSQYWSASAGAIYPLFIRLKRRGLIRITRPTGDRRGGHLYALTTAGAKALRDWLGPPCSTLAASVPPDPLRNRMEFLASLDTQSQSEFIHDAVRLVRAELRKVRNYTSRKKAEGNLPEYFVSRGALRTMQARLKWLLETARFLGSQVQRSKSE